MAAVSAEGSTVWVFIRRLNSSCSLSTAFVVRADRHWLSGNRVKVNNRSPASSRLSATARHFSRHLRMNDLRRASTSFAYADVDHVVVDGRVNKVKDDAPEQLARPALLEAQPDH